MNRGAIWTQPKILAVELITIINLFIISQSWELIKLSKVWRIAALLWSAFLLIGIITTIYSPLPVRSLLGHVTMKSGLLYYGLIAVFTMSNALVLKLKPEVVKAQFQGLLIGGLILSLSIFPQTLNWQIDYTATTGQLIKENILKSTIFQGHQPIGLYSHRGHAAFTLAAVNVMALVAYQKKWINIKQLALYIIPAMPALIFTQTRAGLLALIIAFGYLLGKKHYKVIAVGAIATILIISIISTNRHIKDFPIINQITSNRVDFWSFSTRRIKQRPLFGWGFDGFEIAYPFQPDGKIKTTQALTSKAHNLILDTAVSVGIIGTVVYLILIGFCLYLVSKSSMVGMVGVAIAYLTYTFTWYECAQFTHIFWWSLSFFDYEKVIRSISINNQSVTSYSSMDTRIRSWISAAKARIFRKV
ncbi:lipid A core-O-antigen ligase-like enyme (plasmid) [Nostoc sp. PCC 7524]|nr:lipid A core-O-antigen ligase-like enyme [Nostoc sp. PCC 7524]